jgi:hypothetical protein
MIRWHLDRIGIKMYLLVSIRHEQLPPSRRHDENESRRSGFGRIHASPQATKDVPDFMPVILGPQ